MMSAKPTAIWRPRERVSQGEDGAASWLALPFCGTEATARVAVKSTSDGGCTWQ